MEPQTSFSLRDISNACGDCSLGGDDQVTPVIGYDGKLTLVPASDVKVEPDSTDDQPD